MRRYNIGEPRIGEKSNYKRRWQAETLIEKPVSDAVPRVNEANVTAVSSYVHSVYYFAHAIFV